MTFSKIPDISLKAVKFPDISRFSRQVVTLEIWSGVTGESPVYKSSVNIPTQQRRYPWMEWGPPSSPRLSWDQDPSSGRRSSTSSPQISPARCSTYADGTYQRNTRNPPDCPASHNSTKN